MEIHGTRSSTADQTWSAIQTIFHKDGSTSNLALPGMNFRFGTDGHTHWHIVDFDSYRLLNTDGSGTIAVGEKHDYCVDDNSTPHGGPIPGMPVDPVYTEQISCGDGNPDATSILDGISVGWGDAYRRRCPTRRSTSPAWPTARTRSRCAPTPSACSRRPTRVTTAPR